MTITAVRELRQMAFRVTRRAVPSGNAAYPIKHPPTHITQIKARQETTPFSLRYGTPTVETWPLARKALSMPRRSSAVALFSLALSLSSSMSLGQERPRFVTFDHPPSVNELQQALETEAPAVRSISGTGIDAQAASQAADARGVKPSPEPKVWAVERIEFENGSNRILSSQLGMLDTVGHMMKDDPDYIMVISGHANATGPDTTNDRLSKERAAAVAQFIANNYQIPENRFELRWMGAREPLASLAPADPANRRVQFGVVKPE